MDGFIAAVGHTLVVGSSKVMHSRITCSSWLPVSGLAQAALASFPGHTGGGGSDFPLLPCDLGTKLKLLLLF